MGHSSSQRSASVLRRQRKSHIFEREQYDHYCEPHWVDERLFDVEDFGAPGSIILDPCCGWCRIPDAAVKAGYRAIASDVVDRLGEERGDNFRQLDILKIQTDATYNWWRSASSIISNPPFDDIDKVALRCCALASHKVALVCPIRRLPAAHSWLTKLPLSKVWILTPRPSMPSGEHISKGGKVGGGTVDFCWLIFTKGHSGPATMDWLHRDAWASS